MAIFLLSFYRRVRAVLMGEENVSLDKAHKTGSSDMGNVSSMIPTTSAQVGGVMGEGHSKDFKIVDPEKQYIIPSKAMAMMVVELLNNDAAKAKEVMSVLKPKVLKKDYVRT